MLGQVRQRSGGAVAVADDGLSGLSLDECSPSCESEEVEKKRREQDETATPQRIRPSIMLQAKRIVYDKAPSRLNHASSRGLPTTFQWSILAMVPRMVVCQRLLEGWSKFVRSLISLIEVERSS